jgi:hypothetical protein
VSPTTTSDVTTQAAYLEQLGLGPVQLGSILFTMTDPHPGWEIAYNRWYERDHFYDGCMVGEHNFAGARFVAPRPYKDLRHVLPGALAPDAVTGSYLSLYWVLAGKRQEWNRWAYRQFRWLHENDRMFPHRDHVHTLLYDHDEAIYRDADPVPAALALDHHYAGLVVTVADATDADRRDDLDAWMRETSVPALHDGGPVAQTLTFTGIPLQVDAEGVAKDDGSAQRVLHLSFVETDPAEIWHERFAPRPAELEATGLGRIVWQGPFIPTVPGTDRYTDQLW